MDQRRPRVARRSSSRSGSRDRGGDARSMDENDARERPQHPASPRASGVRVRRHPNSPVQAALADLRDRPDVPLQAMYETAILNASSSSSSTHSAPSVPSPVEAAMADSRRRADVPLDSMYRSAQSSPRTSPHRGRKKSLDGADDDEPTLRTRTPRKHRSLRPSEEIHLGEQKKKPAMDAMDARHVSQKTPDREIRVQNERAISINPGEKKTKPATESRNVGENQERTISIHEFLAQAMPNLTALPEEVEVDAATLDDSHTTGTSRRRGTRTKSLRSSIGSVGSLRASLKASLSTNSLAAMSWGSISDDSSIDWQSLRLTAEQWKATMSSSSMRLSKMQLQHLETSLGTVPTVDETLGASGRSSLASELGYFVSASSVSSQQMSSERTSLSSTESILEQNQMVSILPPGDDQATHTRVGINEDNPGKIEQSSPSPGVLKKAPHKSKSGLKSPTQDSSSSPTPDARPKSLVDELPEESLSRLSLNMEDGPPTPKRKERNSPVPVDTRKKRCPSNDAERPARHIFLKDSEGKFHEQSNSSRCQVIRRRRSIPLVMDDEDEAKNKMEDQQSSSQSASVASAPLSSSEPQQQQSPEAEFASELMAKLMLEKRNSSGGLFGLRLAQSGFSTSDEDTLSSGISNPRIKRWLGPRFESSKSSTSTPATVSYVAAQTPGSPLPPPPPPLDSETFSDAKLVESQSSPRHEMAWNQYRELHAQQSKQQPLYRDYEERIRGLAESEPMRTEKDDSMRIERQEEVERGPEEPPIRPREEPEEPPIRPREGLEEPPMPMQTPVSEPKTIAPPDKGMVTPTAGPNRNYSIPSSSSSRQPEYLSTPQYQGARSRIKPRQETLSSLLFSRRGRKPKKVKRPLRRRPLDDDDGNTGEPEESKAKGEGSDTPIVILPDTTSRFQDGEFMPDADAMVSSIPPPPLSSPAVERLPMSTDEQDVPPPPPIQESPPTPVLSPPPPPPPPPPAMSPTDSQASVFVSTKSVGSSISAPPPPPPMSPPPMSISPSISSSPGSAFSPFKRTNSRTLLKSNSAELPPPEPINKTGMLPRVASLPVLHSNLSGSDIPRVSIADLFGASSPEKFAAVNSPSPDSVHGSSSDLSSALNAGLLRTRNSIDFDQSIRIDSTFVAARVAGNSSSSSTDVMWGSGNSTIQTGDWSIAKSGQWSTKILDMSGMAVGDDMPSPSFVTPAEVLAGRRQMSVRSLSSSSMPRLSSFENSTDVSAATTANTASKLHSSSSSESTSAAVLRRLDEMIGKVDPAIQSMPSDQQRSSTSSLTSTSDPTLVIRPYNEVVPHRWWESPSRLSRRLLSTSSTDSTLYLESWKPPVPDSPSNRNERKVAMFEPIPTSPEKKQPVVIENLEGPISVPAEKHFQAFGETEVVKMFPPEIELDLASPTKYIQFPSPSEHARASMHQPPVNVVQKTERASTDAYSHSDESSISFSTRASKVSSLNDSVGSSSAQISPRARRRHKSSRQSSQSRRRATALGSGLSPVPTQHQPEASERSHQKQTPVPSHGTAERSPGPSSPFDRDMPRSVRKRLESKNPSDRPDSTHQRNIKSPKIRPRRELASPKLNIAASAQQASSRTGAVVSPVPPPPPPPPPLSPPPSPYSPSIRVSRPSSPNRGVTPSRSATSASTLEIRMKRSSPVFTPKETPSRRSKSAIGPQQSPGNSGRSGIAAVGDLTLSDDIDSGISSIGEVTPPRFIKIRSKRRSCNDSSDVDELRFSVFEKRSSSA